MEKLLLIPGPSPVHPRIIRSLSQPTVSHVGPEMVEEFPKALANLKTIVFSGQGEAFAVAGAGTLAMEMALLNTVARGEKILILSHGYFGERLAEICAAFGYDHEVLAGERGAAVPPERLGRAVAGGRYAAAVVTHVDTQTGVCAPVREYGEALRGRGVLFILDGVCATGGIEERLDDWGIDVILTAAQKCLGAPPGLAILVLSERALEKRRSLKSIPAYYSDLLRWLPVMKDPGRYFSTPCVNEIRALYESTLIVLEEGLKERFRRHARTARGIRAALRELGFGFYPEDSALADTLSVVNYPPGLDDKAFRGRLYDRGIVVAGGLGALAGRVFRLGHMGNLSASQVMFALEGLEKTMAAMGLEVEAGAGVRAAKAIIDG